ncbi:succinate--CoA ligase subunit alpha [Desulfosporosinus burensis]
MAVIIDENSRVVIQGITGQQGIFHTKRMLAYGTNIVAGVTPGKGGQEIEGVPIYNTVAETVKDCGANVSCLFVPARLAKDAAFEAIDAGIKVVVVITEHIPVQDEIEIIGFARRRGAIIIGPNTFGIISPGKSKVGIPPDQFFFPGPIGIVARSGTLTYEIVGSLTAAGYGQSTVVGLGGDRVVGLSFTDLLRRFEEDSQTEAVVLIGEIGGNAEEEAAVYIKQMSKPVIAYIAGKNAPPGKRMGHAGAIIERGKGTFQSKFEALTASGALIAELTFQVPELLKKLASR